jgi:ABC-2 type transport system permease protein
MRQLIDIALHDLRITLQGRGAQISLFIVPVIMTVMIGLATTPGTSTFRLDVIRTDPADVLANDFIAQLRAEGGSSLILCDLSQPAEQDTRCNLNALQPDLQAFAQQRVQDGAVLAAVVIPVNFNADLLAGKNVQLGFISKDSLGTAQVVRRLVDATITRLSGAILAARVITDKANGDADFYNKVYLTARELWAKDPVVIEEHTSTTTGTTVGGLGQSAPGIGAMFVMTNVLSIAAALIQERKNGTLQRLVVLPLSRSQILAGKLLSRYLLGVLTFAIMIGVGTFFKVSWGDWSGVIAVVLSYTLAVTAIGLALATLVRSQAQAAGVALLITMILAPLGGAWWPLSIVPSWMQTLGRISPIAWSQDAFNKLVFYGAHLSDVMPSIGVLLIIAAVFFAFGVNRFRYE